MDPVLFSTDHSDPPAQEQPMKEHTQEIPGPTPDPQAKPVREQQAAAGKVRLITPHNEGTECNAKTG